MHLPRILRSSVLAAMLGFNFVCAQPAPSPAAASLTLPEVLSAIRSRHPALAAAAASTEAARARIDSEQSWADPRVGVDFKRDTTQFASYSEIEASISQELPLSGRLPLRAATARAEAAVASAQADRREWMLFNQARLAFTRLAAADERLALNRRLHANLVQTLALARQSYATGQLSQMDLLTLETDLVKIDGESTDLESSRIQETAALNGLMLRPGDTPIGPLALPTPALPALALSDAVARARAMSPDIVVALKELDVARAQLALVRKNRSIDPELSFTARQMNNSGQVLSSYDTGISFSLPWAHPGRTRAEQLEARSRITAARAEADASEAEVAAMVASAHARALAGYKQVKRYQDELLPLARASTEAARRDYENSRAALFTVIAAQRFSLETELQWISARAEQALASAELCFLTRTDANATP